MKAATRHYSLVGGTAPPGGSDPAQIQELLAVAHGYAVFGREAKRVGAVIGLTGTTGNQIAIRHDGTFLWRRRVLPIAAVAGVFPRQRAVLLNVDRHSLARNEAAPDEGVVETSLPSEQSARSSEEVQRRIARYLASGQWETDQTDGDHADEAHGSSAERTAPERPPPAPTLQPKSEHVDSVGHGVSGHLVFLSSSRGYALVELDGPPPALGGDIELPEQAGSFRVAKVGPSPLPNDPRMCAYLEQSGRGTVGRRDS